MNKILLGEDKVFEEVLDGSIKVDVANETKFAGVVTLKIKILKDTDLEIRYDGKNIKYDIYIDVLPSICLNFYEIKLPSNYKLSYRYNLAEKSIVNICKINDTADIRESSIVNLNGTLASVNYLFKTVSSGDGKYNIMVYHNAKDTKSSIINNGVNIKKGTLLFNVSGFVPKGIKNCDLNQTNRIINFTDNVCEIRPNLFIDENDVVASHGAHIGKCNDDELFYLMSRGIDKKEAENLIVQGFLLKKLEKYTDEMKKIINNYWG